MDYLLPATVYQPSVRSGRGRQLNTIVEDNEEMIHGLVSDSEGTASDNTVIGRSGVLDIKSSTKPLQLGRQRVLHTLNRGPPSVVSSDCDEDDLHRRSSRSSYAESDAGTVISDSCPSLTGSHASDATSFATESSRNSTASRNSRNRYPALIIPRGSWALEGEIKQLAFGMSPSTKVRLSPEALERLPRHVPALDATPSLGDSSSVRSESPYMRTANSAPVTPDLHNIEIIEGQSWGGHAHPITLETPLEIAIDEDHSMFLSPQEAHSAPYTAPFSAVSRSSTRWNDLVRQFPLIPGATPIDTPVTPCIPRGESFDLLPSENGVQLPAPALAMLQNLGQQQYAESQTGSYLSEQEEMLECSVPTNRPRTFYEKSPVSEYSISQLSIPSPGGFFSSLKAGARHTWCSPPPPRKTSPPPPSSTTAENFYNTPWAQQPQVKETVIECYDDNETDGPPTVRQPKFDLSVRSPIEDQDMYGSGTKPSTSHEYEESYEDGLKQAAEANKGRTCDWLTSQDSYLSALREVQPSISTPAELEHKEPIQKATVTVAAVSVDDASEDLPSPVREALFLEAFEYQTSETKSSDAFLHASSRLDNIQSNRIALPTRHVQSLLNTHTSKTLKPAHARPKYRGPFSQNPRKTGDFSRTAEDTEFNVLERQQTALNAVKPSMWTLDAQRSILYNGRLMANKAASDRLTVKDAEAVQVEQVEKKKKRRPRVLDLGGAATASWAWAAATNWPNAKVCTVQTKQQADLAQHYPAGKDDVEAYRPETPKNHKVFSVPSFWQLPFRDNYFDVVSARSLHMYLRANPVEGVDSINEWDMTLKECMRVLRPGGVLDFFVMDSGISNGGTSGNSLAVNLSPINMTTANALPNSNSQPKRKDITAEFQTELLRRGYEVDGGCGNLMTRLKQQGFVGVKRQWIGLPMGHQDHVSAAMKMHHQHSESNASATAHWINQFQADGSRKPVFRSAPRPISEVSTISKLVGQYSNVEAVQGPVGSTNDVSDTSALLGELLWEEWLVRLRIESGIMKPEAALEGIEEQFSEWRRSGRAAWRGVVGWARKPSKKEGRPAKVCSIARQPSVTRTAAAFRHGSTIKPLALSGYHPTQAYSAPIGIRRQASVRRHSRTLSGLSAYSGLTIDTSVAIRTRRSGDTRWSRKVNELSLEEFTKSALDRGEVGEIPMMIQE